MKEMIERLIADGWVSVSRNAFNEVLISKNIIGTHNFKLPSCLFPDIKFENSPVELKTLLADNEDKNSIEYKQQQEIRRLIDGNFDYIIREWNNKTIAVYKGDGGTTKTEHLCGLCPDKYKKVYLRDLLKKRKVKKSVWLVAGTEGDYFVFTEKPTRREEIEDFDDLGWYFKQGEKDGTYSKLIDIDAFKSFNLKYEDEPIELTYEVEE